jgi:nucleoside-triphosphatase THEP1
MSKTISIDLCEKTSIMIDVREPHEIYHSIFRNDKSNPVVIVDEAEEMELDVYVFI